MDGRDGLRRWPDANFASTAVAECRTTFGCPALPLCNNVFGFGPGGIKRDVDLLGDVDLPPVRAEAPLPSRWLDKTDSDTCCVLVMPDVDEEAGSFGRFSPKLSAKDTLRPWPEGEGAG